MALGYNIATILKRSSHIFSDDRVCVKTDWLHQMNRKYVQVRGSHIQVIRHVVNNFLISNSYYLHHFISFLFSYIM